MERPIFDTLVEYCDEEKYPWHMPGHKRQAIDVLDKPYHFDVTEVPGLDEYHTPTGIIKKAQKKAAKLYGVYDSFFLVNGSTSGILAAVKACCEAGERLLLTRNCHISVYNAIELLRLNAGYVMPEIDSKLNVYGAVTPEAIEEGLNRWRDISAVIVTSPTYEGVVSDIEEIARVVHKYGKPLIVDEAHGAHLKFMPHHFPKSAIDMGADIVIQSLHKTLPAFTQSAIIHRASDMIKADDLFHAVSMFQTTSPSYLLMAGMDHAIELAVTETERIKSYIDDLLWLRSKLKNLNNISLFEGDKDQYDIGKLVLSAKRDGRWLYDELSKRGQIPEMYGGDHVLLMTTFMDERSAFEGLLKHLSEIDGECSLKKEDDKDDKLIRGFVPINGFYPDTACTIYEAVKRRSDSVYVKLQKAVGHIAADYVYAYPPGIPILAPGELITDEALGIIIQSVDKELNLKGIKNTNGEYIIEVL